MNPRRAFHLLGAVLFILAGAQLLPLVLSAVEGDGDALRGFAAGAGASALLGGVFRVLGRREGGLYRRDGVLIVVGAWVLASLSGAVPYVVSGAIPAPVDALFESVSGYTTTGASILQDIESLSHPVLFWRSFTQWLGGIGIVVLFVALLSELGPGARFLFKLEVPGPKAEILHARVRESAASVFRIYLALSAVQVALLMLFGLGLYDALTHTFSTVSTGGFSPYADSVAHFPAAAQVIILLFMLAAGVNFALYFLLSSRRDLSAVRDTELRCYLGLALLATAVVAADRLDHGTEPVARELLHAGFQVVSILTTTGYATADFATWPGLSKDLLVTLMLVGGCAGSTAGGPKVIRLLIGWRAALREVRLTFSPDSVIAVVVGGTAVPEESVRGVVALLLLWVVGWATGALLLSVGDAGIGTAATASIATLSNIGPGLEAVGPAGNYALFADWQKLVMVLLMWLGRLEFFALLALFLPRFWRR